VAGALLQTPLGELTTPPPQELHPLGAFGAAALGTGPPMG